MVSVSLGVRDSRNEAQFALSSHAKKTISSHLNNQHNQPAQSANTINFKLLHPAWAVFMANSIMVCCGIQQKLISKLIFHNITSSIYAEFHIQYKLCSHWFKI